MTLTEFSGSIRRVLGADLPLGAVTRLSRYTFAARQAERYRDGRILLAHVPCCRPKPRRHCDAETTQPPRASATAAVAAAYMDTTRAIGVEFVEAAHDEPEEWRDAALDNADLWLTAEEFHQVAEELAAVIAPYRRHTRPVGSRLVRVMNVVVPHRRAHPESRSQSGRRAR